MLDEPLMTDDSNDSLAEDFYREGVSSIGCLQEHYNLLPGDINPCPAPPPLQV